jgi:hypothetical protein
MEGRESWPPSPEAEQKGRTIEGKEKEDFVGELAAYIEGLEAALADPDLDDEMREELEMQLEGLKDSQEAIEDGEPVKVDV